MRSKGYEFVDQDEGGLSLARVKAVAPSAFSTTPWSGMTDKYNFLPTVEGITALMHAGFYPVLAMQSRSRIPGKEAYTRHMIRFRHESQLGTLYGGEIPEPILLNAHDGTSAWIVELGLWVSICKNGCLFGEKIYTFRVAHRGQRTVQEVVDASYRVMGQAEILKSDIEHMKQIDLAPAERKAFATAALAVRYNTKITDDGHLEKPVPYTPQMVLAPRYQEQRSPTLWNDYQNLQRNLEGRGSVSTRTLDDKKHTIRKVNSVSGRVGLNHALWALTKQMEAIKTGQVDTLEMAEEAEFVEVE